MIAALFVAANGCYIGLPDVDPWPESRDARTYPGPWPVVAHPPCARWCRLAGLVESRWGHRRGDDGGSFASALDSVRRWGGVLEHPAYSDAWAAFDLPTPPSGGGWQRDLSGGWSAHLEQGMYGHRAAKATWLYAVGCDLPSLDWRKSEASLRGSWIETRRPGTRWRPMVERMGHRERLGTPIPFRDLLLSMARSVALPSQPLAGGNPGAR